MGSPGILFNGFARWSSVPYLNCYGGAKKGWRLKTMWIVLFGISIAVFSLQVQDLLDKYQRHDKTTSVKLVYDGTVDFPAVTVCSLNPYKFSELGRAPKVSTLMSAYNFFSQAKSSTRRSEKLSRRRKRDVVGLSDVSGCAYSEEADTRVHFPTAMLSLGDRELCGGLCNARPNCTGIAFAAADELCQLIDTGNWSALPRTTAPGHSLLRRLDPSCVSTAAAGPLCPWPSTMGQAPGPNGSETLVTFVGLDPAECLRTCEEDPDCAAVYTELTPQGHVCRLTDTLGVAQVPVRFSTTLHFRVINLQLPHSHPYPPAKQEIRGARGCF